MVTVVALLLLFLLALAVRSRRFALALGVLTLLAAVGLMIHSELFRHNRQERVGKDELRFTEARFSPYLNGYRFSARVENTNQRYSIRQLELVFTLLTCKRVGDDDCAVTAEASRLFYVDIAPGAEDRISEVVHFAVVAAAQSDNNSGVQSGEQFAKPGWSYRIERIEAEEDGRLF